ncbi:amidohydrolase family protein [Pigmentiphaga soli]|uniref:Amidohydrolase family protein n=1 Tax=Pigmentiphaga soli TaxID=1007095 RepID=A0ABP8H7D4_9BURK
MQAAVTDYAADRSPRNAAPPNSCDSHFHIYDARFKEAPPANAADTPRNATAADYARLRHRLGMQRAVVVQPRVYGTDNSVTLDAIERLGRDCTRGIAVVTPQVSDAQLHALHDGGIRGVRLTLYTTDPKSVAPTSADMIGPIAHRIAPLGWHVQLHLLASQISEHASVIARLPCPVVFDHLGRLPPGPDALRHPAFDLVRSMLVDGRAWLKLSGAYLNTVSGGPAYADTHAVAREWAGIAPQRLVWGSDWPHVTESHKPDTFRLFDLLAEWVPDQAQRNRILVDNPAVLYGFG